MTGILCDILSAFFFCFFLLLPAEDSAQQRSVEALGRGEPPLHLPDGDLILGGGAEQRQAAWHRAENLGRVGHGAHAEAVLPEGQGGQG